MREKLINKSKIHKAQWDNYMLTLTYLSGEVVSYQDVPEGIYEGLITTKSIGHFIYQYIKSEYSYIIIKD